ncbi:MAG: hypothetical protein V3V61_01020 [Gammaproteobacteria bacterium]
MKDELNHIRLLTESEAKIIDWIREGTDTEKQPPTKTWGAYNEECGWYGKHAYKQEALDPMFEKNPREWFLIKVLAGGKTEHEIKFRLADVVGAMMPCYECQYNTGSRETYAIGGDEFKLLYGIAYEETE